MSEITSHPLSAKEQHESLQKLRDSTLSLVKMSKNDMKAYYPSWDSNWAHYKSEIARDSRDDKAAERGEPQKLVVPLLFSQVMAFIAFIKTLYNSRKTFFELEPVANEDVKSYHLAEQVLDQNLRANKWNVTLFQILLDLCLCNLGVVQLSWETKTRRVKRPAPPSTHVVNGITVEDPGGELIDDEEIVYEGNKIRVISPYRFFPDTRLPVAKYEDGEFCGSMDEFTRIKLRKMEADGFFVGTKHIEDMPAETMRSWEDVRLPMFKSVNHFTGDTHFEKQLNSVAVLHVQRWIIPSEYKIDDKPIGEEDFPCLYDIWIANEDRIIRLEKNAQAFDRFAYFAGQFDCSLHELIADGLAGKINELSSIATWLFNSRIASVRKTIQNWIIADPNMVEMEDLKQRNPVIRLKQQARAGGVDRAIKQLNISDVTQNHISDIATIRQLVEYTTGITENILGLFSGGRRSAKEAQQVFQSAASRLELIAANIDEQLFRAMGEAMLSNITEFMSIETLIRIEGDEPEASPQWLDEFMASGGQVKEHSGSKFIKLDRDNIQGQYNFRFVETTSPSQKNILGATLVEVFDRLAQNPQAAMMSNLDPGKIIREALKLNGVTNLNQFGFSQAQKLLNDAMLSKSSGSPTGEPAPQDNPPILPFAQGT